MSSMLTRFAILMSLLAPYAGHTSPVQATAYQITPDHAGVTASGGSLALQLKPLWSVTLPGAISYPIIADGGVFVTVAGLSGSTYGSQLYAFDAQTGATLWPAVPLNGTYFWSNATYDNGNLFVLNYDGLLRSYDARTGAPGWSAQLQGQYAFSSPALCEQRDRLYGWCRQRRHPVCDHRGDAVRGHRQCRERRQQFARHWPEWRVRLVSLPGLRFRPNHLGRHLALQRSLRWRRGPHAGVRKRQIVCPRLDIQSPQYL